MTRTLPPPRSLVVAAFAVIYLVWGSTYLAIRVAIDTLPPFLMAGARFLVAGALMYGWARSRGAARPDRRQWKAALLLGTLFLLLGNGGVVWAEQYVASGMAAVLVALMPIWTAIVEWVRPGGRRPGLLTSIGLLTGFVGVALLLSPGADGSAVDPLGALVLVGASLSWAIASVLSKGMPLPRSGALSSGMQMLAGGALLALAGLVTGESGALDLEAVSLRSGAALLYLIVFGSLLGFGAFTWLLRVASPARVATYAYVNPLVAVTLGWALLGEPLGLRELGAAAVIIAGVVLITTAKLRNAPS
jgi:drug/metabolite transporter (DMT)-like permease